MNTLDLKRALERPFPADKLHWRVGSVSKKKDKCMPLAYLNARDVMKRLDDVMGFNWQNRYTLSDNGLLICEIGLLINDQWVWRSNGAGDTQVEAEKGRASDAFKRAAVMWGIGRYLYSLPNTWVAYDSTQYGDKQFSAPALPPWASPGGYDAIIERKAA